VREEEQGGQPQTVTFTVGLRSALTKAAGPETTALDDASGSFQLYVAAFNKADGALSAASLIGGTGYAPVAELVGGKACEVSLSLPAKREYKVIFFAQRADAYDVRFADGGVADFSFKSALQANDAALDAFWASVDVSAASLDYEVSLRRPFAQLNVLVPADNVPAGQETFRSTLTVKTPTTFDLYAGAASGESVAVTFAENAISAEPFGKYADATKPYRWVGMNYVLVPASGQVEVTSFRESGMAKAIAPGLVPVKVNGRTNLVGSIYDEDFDITVSVLVDGAFSDAILAYTTPGCYLAGSKRLYVAGADQYVREYDGHALTFCVLNPQADEQLILTGYADTMQVGDAVSITTTWEKNGVTQLSRTSPMSILQDADGLVWIADNTGSGFIIKK